MTTKATGVIWIRQRDTGGVRELTSKDWKHEEKELRAAGYVPCAEDGSPLDKGNDDGSTADGPPDAGTGTGAHDAGAAAGKHDKHDRR